MPDPLRLVVLGDSFAFTDDRGPQLPDDPTLFPNVTAGSLAASLGRPVRVSTVARPGWGVRGLWRALTKDRHLQFEVLAGAGAVVLGVGSYDHLPVGVPPVAEEVVGRLRPAGLRRSARRALATWDRRLIAVWGDRCRRVPAGEFLRLYDLVLAQVRGLTRGAAAVALGPAGQRSPRYASRNPHLERGASLQREVAERHGVAFVPVADLVASHAHRLNPDGVHWPAEVHASVGRAAAAVLGDQLTGVRAAPPDPWEERCTIR